MSHDDPRSPRDAPTAVIEHVQNVMEQRAIVLARILHDELGGHLVSAAMDLGWIEQHLDSSPDMRTRLARVRQAVSSAIDLKRRLTEELRPSLLDNFGLFAAFRWHVKHSCLAAGSVCVESYPETEPAFKTDALTGLFRIMQEMLGLITCEEAVSRIEVAVSMAEKSLLVVLKHEHVAAECSDLYAQAAAMGAIAQRVNALSGSMRVERRSVGTDITLEFPLERVLSSSEV